MSEKEKNFYEFERTDKVFATDALRSVIQELNKKEKPVEKIQIFKTDRSWPVDW